MQTTIKFTPIDFVTTERKSLHPDRCEAVARLCLQPFITVFSNNRPWQARVLCGLLCAYFPRVFSTMLFIGSLLRYQSTSFSKRDLSETLSIDLKKDTLYSVGNYIVIDKGPPDGRTHIILRERCEALLKKASLKAQIPYAAKSKEEVLKQIAPIIFAQKGFLLVNILDIYGEQFFASCLKYEKDAQDLLKNTHKKRDKCRYKKEELSSDIRLCTETIQALICEHTNYKRLALMQYASNVKVTALPTHIDAADYTILIYLRRGNNTSGMATQIYPLSTEEKAIVNGIWEEEARKQVQDFPENTTLKLSSKQMDQGDTLFLNNRQVKHGVTEGIADQRTFIAWLVD